MATSLRSRIKLEGSTGTGSQINTIPVVTAGRVDQTLFVKPVQQTFVVRTCTSSVLLYIKYLNLYVFRTSTVIENLKMQYCVELVQSMMMDLINQWMMMNIT